MICKQDLRIWCIYLLWGETEWNQPRWVQHQWKYLWVGHRIVYKGTLLCICYVGRWAKQAEIVSTIIQRETIEILHKDVWSLPHRLDHDDVIMSVIWTEPIKYLVGGKLVGLLLPSAHHNVWLLSQSDWGILNWNESKCCVICGSMGLMRQTYVSRRIKICQ